MEKEKKRELLKQLMWDYNIPVEKLEAVLEGRELHAEHYTRPLLFQKIIETYPWFTVLQLFTPEEINDLLSKDLINKLRVPSLRKKYEFIHRRLQAILTAAR